MQCSKTRPVHRQDRTRLRLSWPSFQSSRTGRSRKDDCQLHPEGFSALWAKARRGFGRHCGWDARQAMGPV